MLWIFKAVRWMRNRWLKINKSPTFSNGVRTSSFDIWTANLSLSLTMGTLTNSQSFFIGNSNWKFCSVGYPVAPPPPPPPTWHSDADISDFGFLSFLCFYFLVKKSKPTKYTRTLYSQTGENTKWAETFVWCLLLIFKVVYRDHLTQLLLFTRDFIAKGQRLDWGQVG